MELEVLLSMLGVSSVEEAATAITALNTTITDLKAATTTTSNVALVKAVNTSSSAFRQLEQLTGKTGADVLIQVSRWKNEADQLPAAQAAEALAKTEAENAKKKAKKAEGDDDSDEDDDMEAKNEVVAEAMALTNCKELAKLPGALAAVGIKLQSSGKGDTHTARVKRLITEGKLPPHMKAKALAWSPAKLDGFIEMTGGEKFAPVGEEHEPDPEAPEVKAAREANKPPVFDESAIQLDAAERAVVKQMGAGDPELGTRMLAEKRVQAKAAHVAKYGPVAA